MWHVDDGALHAYLDGALDEYPAAEASRVREHLEACAECAGRLAQERRVRDEAHDILGLAAPDVAVPTLEELRAYVRAQAPERTITSVRLYRLSWAASVVLALGTGWLLRGGVPPTVTASQAAFDAESPSAARDAAEGRAQPAASSELDASARESTSEALPTAPAGAAPAAAATPGSAPAEAESFADARGQASPARSELAERVDEVQPSGGAGARFAEPTAVADLDAAAAKVDDVVADAVAGGARRVAAEPSAVPAPATPEVALSASADRLRQDATARDGQPAQRSAEQRLTTAISQAPPPAAAVAGGAPALGRAANADEPSATFQPADTVSLVVPGLEVLDVLRVGEGTTFTGMRALQRLPEGDTLETVHLPEGVDPASLPPLRVGWSEIARPRGSGWIVMRAPLPETTLIDLLQRLEGGR